MGKLTLEVLSGTKNPFNDLKNNINNPNFIVDMDSFIKLNIGIVKNFIENAIKECPFRQINALHVQIGGFSGKGTDAESLSFMLLLKGAINVAICVNMLVSLIENEIPEGFVTLLSQKINNAAQGRKSFLDWP